jgi:predicted nucleic acid-binding protein
LKTYFLDTSAVVRLYAYEPGERLVRDLVRSAEWRTAEVAVCDLAYPETASALHGIVRGRDAARRGLSAAAFRMLLPRLGSELSPGSVFFVVPASSCMAEAAAVASRQEIRGADAVHVAAALHVRRSLPPDRPFLFVSGDDAQCRAAQNEGLEVLRPAA